MRERLLGPTLQQVVEEHLSELHAAGIAPTRPVGHGPWWKSGEEIDMVVRDPGASMTFIGVRTRLDKGRRSASSRGWRRSLLEPG